MRFQNRTDAGRQLAVRLARYAHRPDALVLGLPRGGVPVAYEVAAALGLPLDVFLVRRLGVPGRPELAMGAIASGGIEVLNGELLRSASIPPTLVQHVAVRERLELERRDVGYRGKRPALLLRQRTVILVDDALASGSSMQAAILALRQHAPARVIVAAPVGARAISERLRRMADEVVCVSMSDAFEAVSSWYDDFGQIRDEEVVRLLAAAAIRGPAAAPVRP